MKVGAIDCEHSTKPMRPWMDGFYISLICFVTEGKEYVWALEHDEIEGYDFEQTRQEIQLAIDSVDILCAHNMKHDMNILRYHGINFENVELWCTMVTDYIIHGQDAKLRWGLGECCKRYGMDDKLDKVASYWNQGYDTCEVPMHLLDEYVRDDTYKVLHLYTHQEAEVYKQGQGQLVKLHNDFTRLLSDMELNGFAFDVKKAEEFHEQYWDAYEAIEGELKAIAGDPRINIGSKSQLASFLFGGTTKVSWTDWVTKEFKKYPNETRYYEKKFEEEITLPGVGFTVGKRGYTKGGVPKTDRATLEKLKSRTKQQVKVKELILSLSEVKKVAETLKGKRTETGLINKVQSDGKIHVQLNQAVTKTGRGSSSDPNGQNLPRGSTSPIKQCIYPSLDWVCQYDLSQIEWKIAAELAQDWVMINEINSGEDQHDNTGRDIFEYQGERTDWKIFNFRMIYGGGEWGFFLDHKMPDFPIERWREIVRNFYKKYWRLAEWQRENINAILSGESLVLFTGRRFVFHKSLYKDGIWQYNERQVKNYPVQGLAGGDILPLVGSMIRKGLMKYGLQSKPILTVHDSILFDSPKSEIATLHKLCTHVGDTLSQAIQSYFGYQTSVTNFGGDFEIGKSYGELKKVTRDDLACL